MDENRYREASLTRTLTQAAGFTWCPLGCGTGSVHTAPLTSCAATAEDDDLAIAYCAPCNRQYCRRHGVAWHTEYTCGEYDEMLRQQTGHEFRSAAQRAQDAEDEQRRILHARLDDAERAFDALVRDAVRDGEERVRREEEERRRREEERRRKLEEEERKRREEKRRLEARKRAEEDATRAALAGGGGLGMKVKRCPGPKCTASIEKNRGWWVIPLSPPTICPTPFCISFHLANYEPLLDLVRIRSDHIYCKCFL